ncbi:flavin-dependent oxidoreductase [Paracoccus sp. Z330]|uniref:Flavin-dependent oxidoreductase n=1 Tax=Paracoccus onchidii TaxID=3017813 RepID=A0ABT4ZG30_9RHOB|nr:flavin-dependent oxidoreductase [Paracoccus onchidii]MDB6178052.1 flavin-dependent oxidoreductase [Paracoccus onchidii]
MRVLIAGAGIGGLTTALMLHARGIPCRIWETAPQVREVGVGINVLPHAIARFQALGLLPDLDRHAVRTSHLFYYTRNGQLVWDEPRGMLAGHDVPQFSIHRGRLQKILHDAVLARLGPDAIRCGRRLAGFVQDEAGVTAQFLDSGAGGPGETVRGDVLICADGIHSAGRRQFYPDEGAPSWNGVSMWRGAAHAPAWRGGTEMAIGGGFGAKMVLYPIAPPEADGLQLMNWVVNVRTKDPAISGPPPDNWTRKVAHATVLPFARRFIIPDYDIEALVRATDDIYEYPMADRDPLPRWTFGRITLLGDAAHPMYPVGSNGASQAVLDAESLADALKSQPHPRAGLWAYEQDRRPKTSDLVAQNRIGGPEGVIDAVEKLAPGGFDDIETVLPRHDREALVRGYAAMAGFSIVRKD